MRVRRLGNFVSAAVVSASAFFNVAFVPLAGAAADTCTWTGAGGDAKFSTAGNWAGCDNSNVPEAGDTLRFNTVPANDTTLNNDLGVAFAGVQSAAIDSSNFGTYKINTITLTAGASVSIVPGTTCTMNDVAYLEFDAINGQGNLELSSNVLLGGQPTLTVAGNLTLHSGYMSAGAGSSVSGGIVVAPSSPRTTATDCSGGSGGGGAGAGPSITGLTVNSLTVQKGASVALGNTSFPLTLGGGSGTTAPNVVFGANRDAENNPTATTYTISGAITLLDDAVFYPDTMTTVNVTGSITGAGKQITKSVYAGGTLNINPSSNDSATKTGTLENPEKTTTITDKTTSWVTVVDNETVILDGERAGVSVLAGGTLKGTGTAGDVWVDPGGRVAPGHSPGCINTGNLDMSGIYEFELKGSTACTDHDQIRVTGTVTLAPATAELSTVILPGYTATAGQKYVIVSNDGTDAVTGTFKGLVEGATFTVGNGSFRISYVGGDGNDIELTVLTVPSAPDTGFMLLSANPALTAIVAVLGAGALLYMARRVRA